MGGLKKKYRLFLVVEELNENGSYDQTENSVTLRSSDSEDVIRKEFEDFALQSE